MYMARAQNTVARCRRGYILIGTSPKTESGRIVLGQSYTACHSGGGEMAPRTFTSITSRGQWDYFHAENRIEAVEGSFDGRQGWIARCEATATPLR